MRCARCKGRGEVSSHGFTRSCPRCAGSGSPTRGGGFDHDGDEMFEVADPRDERIGRATRLVWILVIALVVVAIGMGCA